MQEFLIHFDNVVFGYNTEFLLLDHFSLKMYKNDFYIFFGANGLGKTTLFKLIMQQLKPLQGKIAIHSSIPTEIHRGINYLPQREHFNIPFIKVVDIIASSFISYKTFFYFKNKQHKEKAYQILESLNLLNLAHHYFRNLSYGQQQKVLLAYLLANPQPIILLDEPMANLDQDSKYFFYQQLFNISSNRVIIIISHDIFLFPEHKGKFMTLKKGKMQLYHSIKSIDEALFHSYRSNTP